MGTKQARSSCQKSDIGIRYIDHGQPHENEKPPVVSITKDIMGHAS